MIAGEMKLHTRESPGKIRRRDQQIVWRNCLCVVFLLQSMIHAPYAHWPRGGIGRRAGFRFLYSQGCESSTLSEATISKSSAAQMKDGRIFSTLLSSVA
jgi:hypothetical protein